MGQGVLRLKSASVRCLVGKFGNVFVRSAFFQQIDSGALLTANGAAKLGDEKSGLQRFGEGPASFEAPLPGQSGILLLDRSNVAGDLDGDSLAKQGGGQIGPRGLAAGVEVDEGLQSAESVQHFSTMVVSLDAGLHASAGERPLHPQT